MDEVQAKGLISDEESDMVYGVLDLKETKAYSIMVPRTAISSAPVTSTLGDVVKLVSDCGHTRIPIYRNTIDEVVGILHAKDLLKLWGQRHSGLSCRELSAILCGARPVLIDLRQAHTRARSRLPRFRLPQAAG